MIQKSKEVGTSQLSLEVYGDPRAPAIVIVPGVLSDAAEWRQVAQALRSWPRVVVVNRRGRTPSGPMEAGYSLATEVHDLGAVLAASGQVDTLFGWSYGGLIALHAAIDVPVPHVIAYEPVIRPFAADVLQDLNAAHRAQDWPATVRTVLTQIAQLPSEQVQHIAADERAWGALTSLAHTVYPETRALNEAQVPHELAHRAQAIDLVVGEHNSTGDHAVTRTRYGAAFDDVVQATPGSRVHTLAGHGHMAHVQGPQDLAACLDGLNEVARQTQR